MKNTITKILVEAKRKPIIFGLLWLVLFLFLISIASTFGLIVNSEEKNPSSNDLSVSGAITPQIPEKIIIDKISIDVDIVNPESRNIEILNEFLKNGVVRFPGSGLAGGKTNLFLFGHSSHLPVVFNQNYKAFNDLEDLESGDRIKVQSKNTEFVYEVFSVEEADAEDFRVDFDTNRRLLTLSTCNNFGDLDDRFVVQAELVGIRSIESKE